MSRLKHYTYDRELTGDAYCCVKASRWSSTEAHRPYLFAIKRTEQKIVEINELDHPR